MASCLKCGTELPWASVGSDGSLCMSCLLPACYRCGAPGEVPIRPHGVALCLACWREALNVTVGTEAERVPA